MVDQGGSVGDLAYTINLSAAKVRTPFTPAFSTQVALLTQAVLPVGTPPPPTTTV